MASWEGRKLKEMTWRTHEGKRESLRPENGQDSYYTSRQRSGSC